METKGLLDQAADPFALEPVDSTPLTRFRLTFSAKYTSCFHIIDLHIIIPSTQVVGAHHSFNCVPAFVKSIRDLRTFLFLVSSALSLILALVVLFYLS